MTAKKNPKPENNNNKQQKNETKQKTTRASSGGIHYQRPCGPVSRATYHCVRWSGGITAKTHITEKSRHWALRNSQEPRGGILILPLAFICSGHHRNSAKSLFPYLWNIKATGWTRHGFWGKAGTSSVLAGLTPPPFFLSSLCVGSSHWRTACRKAVGGLWIFPFSRGGGVGAGLHGWLLLGRSPCLFPPVEFSLQSRKIDYLWSTSRPSQLPFHVRDSVLTLYARN